MYIEFITLFNSWSAFLQVSFILIISSLITAIFVKLINLFTLLVTALPIIIHGWPVNSDSVELVVQNEEDEDKK